MWRATSTARLSRRPVFVGGVVCVRAEKVNPHGGANKNLVGLYSVSAKKWIVPLAEGSLSFTAADGLVYVTADSKERLIEGYGAEGDGSSDAYSCLMDLQGAIVADAATLAASGADLSADFDGRYLQDGYWLLGEREGGLVAYAENGKVAGIAPAPEHGARCNAPIRIPSLATLDGSAASTPQFPGEGPACSGPSFIIGETLRRRKAAP